SPPRRPSALAPAPPVSTAAPATTAPPSPSWKPPAPSLPDPTPPRGDAMSRAADLYADWEYAREKADYELPDDYEREDDEEWDEGHEDREYYCGLVREAESSSI